MHITPEFAGLLAQVYPALLIAVLIEGRMSKAAPGFEWQTKVFYWVRYFAVFGGIWSTFACLYVFGSKHECENLDYLVTISGALLLISMSAMNGSVMGADASRIFGSRASGKSEEGTSHKAAKS